LGSLPTEQKGNGNGRKNESAYDGTEDDPDFRFLFHGDDGSVCEVSRLNGTAVDECSNFVAIVLVANWSRPDGVLEGKSKKNILKSDVDQITTMLTMAAVDAATPERWRSTKRW
jgi:hypothetical protein